VSDVNLMAEKVAECSHTPGPWMVGNVGQREDPRMVYCDDSLGSRVADCSTSGHGLTVEQDLANARLIAAAPDLYQIGREVLDWVHGKRPGRCVTDDITQRLSAAIAKAEGRS
jgi:hypothetical protein